MADYIKRSEIHDLVNNDTSFGLYKEDDSGCDVAFSISEVHEMIDKIPSADVVEVRRGEWIKARGSWFTPGGDPVWECSECGKGMHVYGIEHGTYGSDVADGQWVACPNCGARMDGGA